MLCRKCNYILTGKENFCPNCGTMPLNAAMPFSESKPKQVKADDTAQQESTIRTAEKNIEFTFPSDDDSVIPSEPKAYIFSPEEKIEVEKPEPQKAKNPAGKILLLLFICCTLAVAAFGIADYMEITPAISSFIQTFSAKDTTSQETSSQIFDHASTVLEPDINYPLTTAYIFSGNGLILRKGPGNGYSPIYSLTDLTQVQIFGGSLASTNWLYVYCPEKECYGWLDGSYICSQAVAESKLSSQYASSDDVPTNYYNNSDV